MTTCDCLRFRGLLAALAVVALACLAPTAAAQQTPEQAALILLESARRAYNEKNYNFATPRFKEFLDKYAGHKEAPSARYGYALCLVEGPEKKYPAAIEQLQQIADVKEFADQPYALYYLALCQRELGKQELAQAQAKPQEAAQRRQAAQQRFEEAAKRYGQASAAFAARLKTPLGPEVKELPIELEWAARARCDQAEMQIRLQKAKDAQATVAPFLSDESLARSRYRRLGLYYHGFACFLQKDYNAAGKSLSQLEPFAEPLFGTHARYLLARVHHVGDEKPEAVVHYEGLITQHAKAVEDAKKSLQNPASYGNNPDEKARLEALVKGPLPDHVARANLYLGVIQYENGKFADALARLGEFRKVYPESPLTGEVQLRQGFCQVHLKQHKEAIATLQPMVDRWPTLADQSLLWIGKAQVGAADPANPKYVDALKEAVETFRKAAERAKGETPEQKERRGLALLEMSDAQQAAGLSKDAAATLGQVLTEKLLPEREDEVLHRQASAHHLAGSYDDSDRVCQQFRERFPRSPLLATVAFRQAENAYFRAQAAEKNKAQPAEITRLQDETIKRYQAVVDQFRDLPQINLARYGLAMGHYRKGDVEKCLTVLEAIPATERSGDLAVVSYVLADCLIRTAPADTSDAIAAGKYIEHMTKASEALASFTGANPKAPQTPDALLKLGHCQMGLAEILAEPPRKQAALQAARVAYDTVLNTYPQHELFPQATLERARSMAQANDIGGAMNELQKFTRDPLKNSSVAPLALLRLAALMRAQNRAQDAVNVMAAARKDYEPIISKDPARAAWVPLLRYHHGVALQEVGKRVEARQVFDEIVQQFAASPEAIEASLRSGQCLRDEGKLKLETAQKVLSQPQGKPNDQLEAARKQRDEGLKNLRDSVTYLEERANQYKDKDHPARARMLYDAAWGCRALAEIEVADALTKLQAERWQKLKDEVARKTPMGKAPFPVPMPQVSLSEVALQPSEERTRKIYQALIAAFPDLASSADARFELAELLSERNDHDAAIKLLQAALDQEPPAELTQRIQLRLGICLAGKGDSDNALKRFEPLAKNDKSPLQAQALYRAGECYLQKKNHDEAIKRLVRFRDDGRFQNVPGVTDRALLRLGHALREGQQWDQSRQAHEQVVNRFGQGPWAHEARYGIGWAHQMKGEYDQAINAYNQVTAGTVTELAARAQLNIGLCRLAQKKYAEASTAFLVVPFTYDYPELSATALLEAARALAEDKQKDKAIPLLERLLRDHPESEHAEAARKRLETLRKES